MTKRLDLIDLVKQSLESVVHELLSNKDLPTEHLVEIAFYRFACDFGGLQIYIPKNSTLEQRNNLIRREFKGNNHLELARKYHLSIQWIYAILKEDF